jgi:hypothetical protein
MNSLDSLTASANPFEASLVGGLFRLHLAAGEKFGIQALSTGVQAFRTGSVRIVRCSREYPGARSALFIHGCAPLTRQRRPEKVRIEVGRNIVLGLTIVKARKAHRRGVNLSKQFNDLE